MVLADLAVIALSSIPRQNFLVSGNQSGFVQHTGCAIPFSFLSWLSSSRRERFAGAAYQTGKKTGNGDATKAFGQCYFYYCLNRTRSTIDSTKRDHLQGRR
uniref:Uncharacterized protein n=1 Tax=Melanopsichium pennsylvanicum 4 TaxID=1398559 RepID=A0A077QZ42_9BASI|nr:uncharacterized protein BN887_06205 [Melanopsichium pennsylvanicum 4]